VTFLLITRVWFVFSAGQIHRKALDIGKGGEIAGGWVDLLIGIIKARSYGKKFCRVRPLSVGDSMP
jgi:hypothetical protein